MSDFLTVSAVAQRLGIARSWLRRRIQSGEVAVVAGRIRFRDLDVIQRLHADARRHRIAEGHLEDGPLPARHARRPLLDALEPAERLGVALQAAQLADAALRALVRRAAQDVPEGGEHARLLADLGDLHAVAEGLCFRVELHALDGRFEEERQAAYGAVKALRPYRAPKARTAAGVARKETDK